MQRGGWLALQACACSKLKDIRGARRRGMPMQQCNICKVQSVGPKSLSLSLFEKIKNAEKRTSMLPLQYCCSDQSLKCFESCIAWRFIWGAHGRVGAKNDEPSMVMTVGLGGGHDHWGWSAISDQPAGLPIRLLMGDSAIGRRRGRPPLVYRLF